MEYGLGYIKIRSPYNPYSIYLRGTIGFRASACSSALSVMAERVMPIIIRSCMGTAIGIHSLNP